jgi:hypothetical protein
MTKTATLLFFAGATLAHAQSTSTLGQAEARTSYQIALGGSSSLIGSGYGAQTGALRALSVSQRREIEGWMDLRFDAWAIQRRPSADASVSYLNARYDGQTGHYQRLNSSWVLAGIVAASFPVHLPLDLIIDPTLGLGVVPVASGRWIDVADATGASSSAGASSTYSQGIVFTAGVSMRWHHVFVAQHVIQVMGADTSILNGENAPLMIGWRF